MAKYVGSGGSRTVSTAVDSRPRASRRRSAGSPSSTGRRTTVTATSASRTSSRRAAPPSAPTASTRCRCRRTAGPTGSRLGRRRHDERGRRLREERSRDLRDARLRPARALVEQLGRTLDPGVPAAALHARIPQLLVLRRRPELARHLVRDVRRLAVLLVGSWLFRVDMPVREAWAEANEIVEGLPRRAMAVDASSRAASFA